MLKIKFLPTPKIALAILIPLTVSLASCDDKALFDRVQRFSNSAEELEKQFPNIATDVYDSCFRTAQYTPIQGSARPFGDRDTFRQNCTQLAEDNVAITRREFEGELIAVNSLIVNYLLALSAVAGGDKITYTNNINALGSAVSDIEPRLQEDEIKAGQNILDFIANALSNEFRQEALATEITSTNEPLQVYICLLKKDVVGQYLNAELQTEKKAVDEYYRAYIDRELQNDRAKQEREYLIQQYLRQELQLEPEEKTLPTKPPITVMKLEHQWRQAVANVRQREMTAKGYIDILNTIANGHSQLAEQLGGSGKGQTELCPNQPDSLLVFSKFGEMFSEEIKESDPIATLTKYTDRIEFMLAKLNSIDSNN